MTSVQTLIHSMLMRFRINIYIGRLQLHSYFNSVVCDACVLLILFRNAFVVSDTVFINDYANNFFNVQNIE